MDIQQNHLLYSTWVTTLLEAVSKNIAMDKSFRANPMFEDSEHVGKAIFAKIIAEKFGEDAAISEISKLWPSTSPGILMDLPAMKTARYRVVKRGLIENYFKFKTV